MTRRKPTLIAAAIAYLDAEGGLHTDEMRGLHIHRDDATCGWWMTEDDDLEVLGRLLHDDEIDAYSRWCSATTGVEIDIDAVVDGYDADEDSDLDVLQAEVLADEDMASYMALRFLRDDIVQTIATNAEIAAEEAA